MRMPMELKTVEKLNNFRFTNVARMVKLQEFLHKLSLCMLSSLEFQKIVSV